MNISTLSKISSFTLIVIAIALAATLWWAAATLDKNNQRQQAFNQVRQQFSGELKNGYVPVSWCYTNNQLIVCVNVKR